MMENSEQETQMEKIEEESQMETCDKMKTFPIARLPVELQLQILAYVLAHDKPIVVSGFTSTYSFALPSPVASNSFHESTHSTSAKPWSHLPFAVTLASKHMHNLCESLLFAPRTNTFMFTTPLSRQWSYARDWYWTFSFMVDHSKGTSAAMKRMSRVIFKCDGSMDNSLIGTAIEYLPSMVILTVDFKDFWGSPFAKLEEEGRRGLVLGGFGGHVVLPDRGHTRTPVYSAVEGVGEVCHLDPSSPASATFNVPEVMEKYYAGYRFNCKNNAREANDESEEFVSVVWRNVVVTCNRKRAMKELRFSGLKVGRGNWDEVIAYGERVTGYKGSVEADVEVGDM